MKPDATLEDFKNREKFLIKYIESQISKLNYNYKKHYNHEDYIKINPYKDILYKLRKDSNDSVEKIVWKIDHDYPYGYYLLSGDYKGNRFVRGVRDGFWGIPLMYTKWCMKRQFNILDKN